MYLTDLINIAVNNFDAKKSALCNRTSKQYFQCFCYSTTLNRQEELSAHELQETFSQIDSYNLTKQSILLQKQKYRKSIKQALIFAGAN